MTARYPGAAFVEAAQYTKAASSNGAVTRIVIHDMEMAESNTTAESCARMFHTTSRQASEVDGVVGPGTATRLGIVKKP